jgi:hypothetical protein
VALSLRANLPLVYPYGETRDYTAAFAIEGAYDVGHPTLPIRPLIGPAQAGRSPRWPDVLGWTFTRYWPSPTWKSARRRS